MMRLAILMFLAALCLAGQSDAKSNADYGLYWNRKISIADALISKYEKEEKRLGLSYLGPIYSHHMYYHHKCAVIGRYLGLQRFVKPLEVWREPEIYSNMSWEDEDRLQLFIVSMMNFKHAVNDVLGALYGENAAIWDLECVGEFGIPSWAWMGTESIETAFRVDGKRLIVVGDIRKGFAEKLARAVAESPGINTVALGSGGGSIADAIKAGRMIRAMGLETTLWSNCYSACTLTFLGGVRRDLMASAARLGFHQASIYGEDISPASLTYASISNYTVSMGANPRFVLAAMFAATSNGMYIPPLNALCENDIVTWVQRVCSGYGRDYN